jgi:hypothetical protein
MEQISNAGAVKNNGKAVEQFMILFNHPVDNQKAMYNFNTLFVSDSHLSTSDSFETFFNEYNHPFEVMNRDYDPEYNRANIQSLF